MEDQKKAPESDQGLGADAKAKRAKPEIPDPDERKVRVLIVRPSADTRGNIWRKGRKYWVSETTANGMLARGRAVLAATDLVKDLKEMRAGIAVTGDTDQDLVSVAEEQGLNIVLWEANPEAAEPAVRSRKKAG